MRIIEDNIDKISLDEWEDGTHIWEVMLPEIRKHLGGEPSIFDGIQCNRQFGTRKQASHWLNRP